MIKPIAPKAPENAKAAPKDRPRGQGVAEAYKFWDNYFKTHEESPEQVYQTFTDLVKSENFDQGEAIIKAYLRYLDNRRAQSEPWMYIWLAKMIEQRKGPEAEVKTMLGFAGHMAKKTRNPADLIRVADMLVVRKFYENVGMSGYQTNIGELLDLEMAKDPADWRGPMMSVNLALHDSDPKRMADAADRLLSLGWPGLDDKVRRDVKEQVQVLEKTLRENARTDEADALIEKLAESEARDLYFKLTWSGEADIDMTVDEPLGARAGFGTPRTVFGGAIVKNGYGTHPEEVYVCPRAFPGDYTIRVETIYNDEAKPVTAATLEVITHEGTAQEKRETHKIDLAKPSPIVVHLDSGRRKQVLPYVAAPERPVVADPEKTKADPGPVNPAPPATPKPATIR
ncbi:tetratricopeptide repeat protein [Tundrisphaera lichenicola]|uniref:tetratricopeptide repeat protein n=1 Tax=Tundrisphaera lichenicola TaxID=2029860 RepID=UPI003EB794CF